MAGFIRRKGAGLALAAALGAAGAASGGLILPAAAQATETATCEVTGGTLTWGLKESFRSYISGTIANGSWEATDGAAYETPSFTFGGATGSIDTDAGTGKVGFAGTVHFTGHGGVLDLTIANPSIEFDGGGSAALLLDVRGTDMEGQQALDEKQVWFGKLTDVQLRQDGATVGFAKVNNVLTDSGAKAFAGFYKAGQELDPVTIELQTNGECKLGEGAAGAEAAPAKAAPAKSGAAADEAGPGVPVLPLVIGGVAIVVIAVAGTLLIRGGAKKATAAGNNGETGGEG